MRIRLRPFRLAIKSSTTILSVFFASSLACQVPNSAEPFATPTLHSASAGKAIFDIATIKRPVAGVRHKLGFYGYPGGKVLLGGSVKLMMYYAFGVEEFQIAGGPTWIGSDQYDLVALPQNYTEHAEPKTTVVRATPSLAERTALRALLADRFGLTTHTKTKEGNVYVLERGSGPLLLQEPSDKAQDPRGGVFMRPSGVVDGEAMAKNVTMGFLAKQLSSDLGRPVVDHTGLAGSYDFHLEADDPTNTDMVLGVLRAMQRLGLRLHADKGPVETIVIDAIARPTEN